jgi:beta-xylosidase
MRIRPFRCAVALLLASGLEAQSWIPDLGDGRYRNPVLFADYSDPDVTASSGGDFYMVASSFNCMPGIPVLHSRDLVNWTLIGHVYDRLPFEKYDKPAHGEGSWAPSIRFHDGLYYVYFCTPHEGLFMARAADPAGPWTLKHVVAVEMWEDPCPFWDDDGNAYLVRSKLRADILTLHRMSPDGERLLDNGTVLYTDTTAQPVIEGPKLLKKDGYYYILAPAGGVTGGWQAVLRSKSIRGPYEARTVLHQGGTGVNGPHQGGIVRIPSGEWWFLHFQDKGAYGRIVHLEPVEWKDGWPLIGVDADGDGVGEPVGTFRKPRIEGTVPVSIPQTSDDFDSPCLGTQWQWHANPAGGWASLERNAGRLRLESVRSPSQNGNFWFVPNLLLQKFPGPAFTTTARIEFHPASENEKAGLVVMGREWAAIGLVRSGGVCRLLFEKGQYRREEDATVRTEGIDIPGGECLLRVRVEEGAKCAFSYSLDGSAFLPFGGPFTASAGMWIGAKVGLFGVNPNVAGDGGYADFDWVRFE